MIYVKFKLKYVWCQIINASAWNSGIIEFWGIDKIANLKKRFSSIIYNYMLANFNYK